MKIYTIIGGLNGAGKSSLTGLLKTERDDLGLVIDVDRIAKDRNISNLEAGKIALDLIEKCLDTGVNFTQETTLSGHRTLKTIKEAKKRDYFIRLYYVGVSGYGELLARIKNRVKKGGHNISEKDLTYRFNKYVDDLCAVLPYCDKAMFYDNENGFAEIARFKNGELHKTAESVPQWTVDIINRFNEI